MSLLFVIASIGVINGVLVSLYLLFKKGRSVAETYFAGLVLTLSIRIGKSIYFYFGTEDDRLLLQLGLSACTFIGPFFYLYSKTLFKGEQSFKRADIALLLVLLFVIITVGIIYPYTIYPEVWNGVVIYGIYGSWGGFAIPGFYFGIRTVLKSKELQIKPHRGLQYQIAIMLAMLFITTTYMTALFFGIAYIWGAVIFTIVFYYLAGRILLTSKPVIPRDSGTRLENGASLLRRVNELMEKEKPYLNRSLKLDYLAEKAGMSRHLLSKVLNEEYLHGFAQYVKEYRVEEAKRMIATRNELSLEGIGHEAGFSSKSAFFEAFKKIEGATPSQYRKASIAT
ncbi:MAG: helix-turn-helix domain-containing protein [Bacteroidota bacterium]